MIRVRFSVLLILLSAAAVVSQVYYTRIVKPNLDVAIERSDRIVAGTEVAPYRYRVLMPLIAEGLTRLLSVGTARPNAFRLAFRILDPLAVIALVLGLFVWFTEWFTAEQALVGVLFITATIPIALQDHDFQPWSLPEAALFTAALIATRRGYFGTVAVIVVLASLNRETAVFIPIAFFLIAYPFSGGGDSVDDAKRDDRYVLVVCDLGRHFCWPQICARQCTASPAAR